MVVGCAEQMKVRGPAPAPETFLPAFVLDGWQQDSYQNPVRHYTAQSLYLYLGEGAERYKSYHVDLLTHATYRFGLLGAPAVSVDVFRMDKPLDAYGIFSVERDRTAPIAKMGAVSTHMGEKQCDFWRGCFFVRVKIIGEVKDAKEALEYFAKNIDEKMKGEVAVPELSLFPAENRVVAGDSHYVKNLLGCSFLGAGFTVEYDLAGKKATMFMACYPTIIEAENAWIKLHRALAPAGSEPVVLPGPWQRGYRATEPKLGRGLVAQQGAFVAGIFGVDDEKVASEMVGNLVLAIKAVSTPKPAKPKK
jgi:hypothetical protein